MILISKKMLLRYGKEKSRKIVEDSLKRGKIFSEVKIDSDGDGNYCFSLFSDDLDNLLIEEKPGFVKAYFEVTGLFKN